MGAKERLSMRGFQFLPSAEDVSARNISEATDRRTGEKNFGTQGIKDLMASSKANLHSSGLQEGS